MNQYFAFDHRLGILLPNLDKEWHHYSREVQQDILAKWETIRGQIPDRIKDIENVIRKKQAELNVENNFQKSCQLNAEISDMASMINDLWIWYRTEQSIEEDKTKN